jgi:hypothetical protein
MAFVAEGPDKTIFQTADHWSPRLDIRSDVAVIYGMNASFPERLRGWKERGYGIQFMTGVAWGGYQDYLEGRFDGKNHMDEGQVDRNGQMIMHDPTVPYMVPTQSYIEYLKTLIAKAIDGGVTAIHLEEPEFWNRGGYSEGFKREWQAYYNEPWQAQHISPEATYRSAKLKYHLYYRALDQLFTFAKEYSAQKGQTVRCYVPTHTLINYSVWQIVSPESFLAHLPGCDGYIAQVWTGTARTPVIYKGVEKERTFENAYLEYASMVAMTKPTGRKVFFLTDPIEDNPNHTWEDYKLNYEATFTAQLMQASVADYEVMPWPNRIFNGRYQVEGSNERQPIPPDYASELMTLITTLNDIPVDSTPVEGTQGVGVMLSDTLMFQRFPTHAGTQDPRLSNFYGMVLPLLKHGIPVELVQMENLPFPDTLKSIRFLVMSYASMKPQKPEYHQVLVNWMKAGGSLVYCGTDNDSFQTIREWWNQEGMNYAAPSEHLFELAGIEPTDQTKTYTVGEGTLTIVRQNPLEIAFAKDGGEMIRDLAKKTLKEDYHAKNSLVLHRGPYDIIAVMDESVSDAAYTVAGPVIDLYDASLPVLNEKSVKPGERAFLYNLNRNNKKAPCILASASRADWEERTEGTYAIRMKGPEATNGIARILLPGKPIEVNLTDSSGAAIETQPEWDETTKTLRLRYPNSPDGVWIRIAYEVKSGNSF